MSVNLLLLALATTCSPLFVLTAVVMMSTSMTVHNAWAAVAGWIVSIGVSAAAVMLIGGAFASGSHHGAPWWMGLVDVVIGGVLAVLALREWFRFRSDPASGLPKWFDRVGSMSIVFAFGVGVFLPANIVAYAAGNEIAQQHLSGDGRWLALVGYVVVGTLLEAGPVLWFTVARSQRERRLPEWNRWLGGHWQEVLAGLFTVLSLYLLLKGGVVLARSV